MIPHSVEAGNKEICRRDQDGFDQQNVVPISSPNHVSTLYNNVVISGSENIYIGDRNYFNGNVVVKQIVLPDNTSDIHVQESADSKSLLWIVILFAVVVLSLTTLSFLVKAIINGNVSASDVNELDEPSEPDYIFNITKNGLQILERQQWSAQPPERPLVVQSKPVNKIIIGHTGKSTCFIPGRCIYNIRYMQTEDIEDFHLPDIRHNFLIGGDGRAYVGLGWSIVGNHTDGYNNDSVDMMFFGNFSINSPPEKQIQAAQLLIEAGVQLGTVSPSYQLFAQCQLLKTDSPGKYLYQNVTSWKHFNNSIKCIY
uniref:Peptidoglycan recognition protein family domain-containing protein n=2 Tax=Clastoptera arizonana TaxID=38151 RepID=A0A1B6BZN6_9HEMI